MLGGVLEDLLLDIYWHHKMVKEEKMKGLLELLDWIPGGPANGLSAVFHLLIAPSEVGQDWTSANWRSSRLQEIFTASHHEIKKYFYSESRRTLIVTLLCLNDSDFTDIWLNASLLFFIQFSFSSPLFHSEGLMPFNKHFCFSVRKQNKSVILSCPENIGLISSF